VPIGVNDDTNTDDGAVDVVVNTPVAVASLPAASVECTRYWYDVDADNPDKFTECAVTADPGGDDDPYDVVAPHSTNDTAASFVTHDTTADDDDGDTANCEITGGDTSGPTSPHTNFASPQSAWSKANPSPAAVTTNRTTDTPATGTDNDHAPSDARNTGDCTNRPAAASHTSNTTDAAEVAATSSSTPTCADNERHPAGTANRTSLAACTPKPLGNTTPPIVNGAPSPAAFSPFD